MSLKTMSYSLKTMKIDLGIIEVEKTESNPIAEKGVEEC